MINHGFPEGFGYIFWLIKGRRVVVVVVVVILLKDGAIYNKKS